MVYYFLYLVKVVFSSDDILLRVQPKHVYSDIQRSNIFQHLYIFLCQRGILMIYLLFPILVISVLILINTLKTIFMSGFEKGKVKDIQIHIFPEATKYKGRFKNTKRQK